MTDSSKPVVFSIIIPTKNEEKQIAACLEKIFQQDTTLPYEVIIVDSSSTELTASICKLFTTTVIKEHRAGKGIAVNTGAHHARGKYLCFTEADCRVPSDWLSVIYDEFQKADGLVAVVGDYTYYDSTWFYDFLLRITMPLGIWGFYLLYHNHSLRGTNFAVRTSAYLQAGGFLVQARELQDVEFGLRLRKFGRIRYLPAMRVKTSARRVQGRLSKFIREFIPVVFRLLVLKKVTTRSTYEDIR